MSGVWNWAWKGSKRVWNNTIGKLYSGTQIGTEGVGQPKQPAAPEIPSPPTTDDALKNQQESDRIRKRRGVLANIFAGSNAAAPTVGTKTLLGS